VVNIRHNILKVLRQSPGLFVSGGELSRFTRISRAAVWKHVTALRREGYCIEARSRCGYRLMEEPDRLRPGDLETKGVVYHPVLDSTNLEARRLAEAGAAGDLVIITEEQRRGKGRRERLWASPPGVGLWFSLLLRPREFASWHVSPVTLVVAASICRTLREITSLPAAVKWPNDLLLGGRKICGILTELKGEPDHIDYLIIGIGLNVNHVPADFPSSLRETATSLYRESGRRWDRTDLFLSLLENLKTDLECFFREGFAPFRPVWKEYTCTLGKRVKVAWPGGLLEGTALEVDGVGALLLEDDQGTRHRVTFGELDDPANI
jgi:BirA family biotin operon repressor/biotin-[acetyl-CoA-carboxylase] ligase